MPPCSDTNPLRRDGLSQPQRRLPALDPASVRLDDRTGDDLLRFAAAYAQRAQVQFHPTDGAEPDATTWARLFTLPEGETLADREARADNPPHLALFMAFLKVFGLLQEQLNTLPQRHLDFYYREVLQLAARPAVPDQVHVVFELAKNVAELVLPAGTELDAGPDAQDQPLRYPTTADTIVNQASLAHLRAVYHDPASKEVLFAAAANTADGVAAPLPETDPSWNAFGPKAGTASWPVARVGFALAAPVLLMAEGQREVTVTFRTADTAVTLTDNLSLQVQLSGSQGWIEAPATRLERVDDGALRFTVTLPESEKQAVVGYDPARHDGGYATTAPVLRALLVNSKHYDLLRRQTLRDVTIDVRVSGLKKSLVLDNDLGRVNPEKPFFAFGNQPGKGSTLYVGCPEVAAKDLTSLTVTVPEWLSKPSEWATHYAGYTAAIELPADSAESKTLGPNARTSSASEVALQADRVASLEGFSGATEPMVRIKVQNRRLRAEREVSLFGELVSGATFPPASETKSAFSALNMVARPAAGEALSLAEGSTLKKATSLLGRFSAKALAGLDLTRRLDDVVEPATVGDSVVTLRLSQELGHRVYAKLLTEATLRRATGENVLVPNLPYAPQAQELRLSYAATSGAVSLLAASPTTFPRRAAQLFHQSVFGQAEEHVFLKADKAFLTGTEGGRGSAFLLPQLAPGGTFLLGLRGVGPQENVSVLFQVAEGSANPDRQPAQLSWSVLSQNQWRPLTAEHLLRDTTNHLLISGIIEFSLPAETTLDNTLLDAGLVWLRAELKPAQGTGPVPIDSVCNVVAVHPQAALARLHDAGNDPAHYAAPLPPGTIAKTRQSVAGLKAVQQPYASFGGQPAETDLAFYTRVSERLRHKQRAVTIWDYEHLVLQQFPGIYKVKCLNHARLDATGKLHELAPGCVTLVAVPDLRNAHALNPLQPRVDLSTLAAVQDFLQRHAGPQVQVQVVNPAYEPVRVSCQVAFRPGYPFTTYRKRLEQDLVAYLSPWAFDADTEIPFGGRIHQSTLLSFIEQRPYVDFVTELTLTHTTAAGAAPADPVVASSPRAVLVASPTHTITSYQGPRPA